jgi:hypothetical protein
MRNKKMLYGRRDLKFEISLNSARLVFLNNSPESSAGHERQKDTTTIPLDQKKQEISKALDLYKNSNDSQERDKAYKRMLDLAKSEKGDEANDAFRFADMQGMEAWLKNNDLLPKSIEKISSPTEKFAELMKEGTKIPEAMQKSYGKMIGFLRSNPIYKKSAESLVKGLQNLDRAMELMNARLEEMMKKQEKIRKNPELFAAYHQECRGLRNPSRYELEQILDKYYKKATEDPEKEQAVASTEKTPDEVLIPPKSVTAKNNLGSANTATQEADAEPAANMNSQTPSQPERTQDRREAYISRFDEMPAERKMELVGALFNSYNENSENHQALLRIADKIIEKGRDLGLDISDLRDDFKFMGMSGGSDRKRVQRKIEAYISSNANYEMASKLYNKFSAGSKNLNLQSKELADLNSNQKQMLQLFLAKIIDSKDPEINREFFKEQYNNLMSKNFPRGIGENFYSRDSSDYVPFTYRWSLRFGQNPNKPYKTDLAELEQKLFS